MNREHRPLNSIGMPYYDKPLLSRLPASFDFVPSPLHHTPIPIDPSILATVKNLDFVGYAPYPASARAAGRRNQVPSDLGIKAKRAMDVPMFRSEKDRQQQQSRSRQGRIVSVGRLMSCHPKNDIDLSLLHGRWINRRKLTTIKLKCRIIIEKLKLNTVDLEWKISILGSLSRLSFLVDY
jgi:hypothetical protein